MKIVLILIATMGLGAAVVLQELRPKPSVTDGVVFNFNEGFPTFSSDALQFMSFGYSRVFSNLLWLRFLQHTPPKSMGDNEVSWIYLDLEAISTIDPEFEPVYFQGAVFLSVITEDKRGAEILLKKATRIFPNNWQYHSYLAYHYQFEMKLPEKAGPEYEWAARLPDAPALMGLLAARYKAKTEGVYASIEFLRTLRDASQDEEIRKKFDKKIINLLSGYDENRSH
jgi:hypothetical protein